MADLITAIVLTYNEEKNIKECILSLKLITNTIFVVDSYSSDNTVLIAKSLGCKVIQHEFESHAKQFIFALDNLDIESNWVIRLDADERITKQSAEEIIKIVKDNDNTDINGVYLNFEYRFLGRVLKHGGVHPVRMLRLFKPKYCFVENKLMDEHIVVESGRTKKMKTYCQHFDNKDISYWVEKHNKYSTNEMIDYFNNSYLSDKKRRIYYKLPRMLRCKMYYIFRYYFRFGFLDGVEGKIYALLQTYFYRILVEAKIIEKKRNDVENKDK